MHRFFCKLIMHKLCKYKDPAQSLSFYHLSDILHLGQLTSGRSLRITKQEITQGINGYLTRMHSSDWGQLEFSLVNFQPLCLALNVALTQLTTLLILNGGKHPKRSVWPWIKKTKPLTCLSTSQERRTFSVYSTCHCWKSFNFSFMWTNSDPCFRNLVSIPSLSEQKGPHFCSTGNLVNLTQWACRRLEQRFTCTTVKLGTSRSRMARPSVGHAQQLIVSIRTPDCQERGNLAYRQVQEWRKVENNLLKECDSHLHTIGLQLGGHCGLPWIWGAVLSHQTGQTPTASGNCPTPNSSAWAPLHKRTQSLKFQLYRRSGKFSLWKAEVEA